MWVTTSQAPGDEDEICVQINQEVRQEVNQGVHVLMSSFNYRDLIIGGPWVTVNNDSNNDGFSATAVSEMHYESMYILLYILL